MRRRLDGTFTNVLVALGTVCALGGGAPAAVDLELRPGRQESVVGDIVDVQLFAVSDSAGEVPVAGIEVALNWDADLLRLLVNVDPCTEAPCPAGTYRWLQSYFPEDELTGCGLNKTFDDGEAYYVALSQLGAETAAVVTQDGLWVTSLRFAVIGAGTARISVVEAFEGCTLRTRVTDGLEPGQEVTGTLGPAVEVDILACATPSVEAVGSRYLGITPGPALNPVALVVAGEPRAPETACVELYVQGDASLAATPDFRLPDDWGTVAVTAEAIRPDTSYHVRADCQLEGGAAALSGVATARTWIWGDTNGDGGVPTIADLGRVIDASNGNFDKGTRLENVDLMPCAPDGVVDQADVSAAQAAVFGGAGFGCEPPCRATFGLAELASFLACLAGPDAAMPPDCESSDHDGDSDADLLDFAEVQVLFGTPLDSGP